VPEQRPSTALDIQLRNYQEECPVEIKKRGPGRWLCQLATGLGKTVIFSFLPKRGICQGRMLIVSHRRELVHQPVKYFNCPVGIEMAGDRAGRQSIVSASIQTLSARLDKFTPDYFDTIVVDEAHHAASATYRKVLDHFRPRLLLGFTATPNRGDGARLDDVFDEIIFQRDLRWGIENGYLANIECLKVNIGYDLAGVRSRMGDYAVGELERAVNIEGANKAIGEVCRKYAKPPVLVFGVTVDHCHRMAEQIPGAVVVEAKTKNRGDIFSAFMRGDIPCLINCEIATEGTDLPGVRTVMMVRPTQSVALYTQMVGRGTRKTADKDQCLLIDCVGNDRHNLCTAPSLIGLDPSDVPTKYQMDLVGDLLADLPDLIEQRMDTPETWIKNVQIVNLWAKKAEINLHDVNFFRHADGSLAVYMAEGKWTKISAPDLMGQSVLTTNKGFTLGGPMQDLIDATRLMLDKYAADQHPLWSMSAFKRWGNKPASDKQRNLVAKLLKDFDTTDLTKGQASLILNRKLGMK
jgi:superfamily II DNA or RNA helicase